MTRDQIRDAVLDDAMRNGNSVEHATDLAEAFVEVYDEAARVAALPDGEFPRPSSLVLAKHAQLYDRLTVDVEREAAAERALVTGMCAADEHVVDHPLCNVCRPERPTP